MNKRHFILLVLSICAVSPASVLRAQAPHSHDIYPDSTSTRSVDGLGERVSYGRLKVLQNAEEAGCDFVVTLNDTVIASKSRYLPRCFESAKLHDGGMNTVVVISEFIKGGDSASIRYHVQLVVAPDHGSAARARAFTLQGPDDDAIAVAYPRDITVAFVDSGPNASGDFTVTYPGGPVWRYGNGVLHAADDSATAASPSAVNSGAAFSLLAGVRSPRVGNGDTVYTVSPAEDSSIRANLVKSSSASDSDTGSRTGIDTGNRTGTSDDESAWTRIPNEYPGRVFVVGFIAATSLAFMGWAVGRRGSIDPTHATKNDDVAPVAVAEAPLRENPTLATEQIASTSTPSPLFTVIDGVGQSQGPFSLATVQALYLRGLIAGTSALVSEDSGTVFGLNDALRDFIARDSDNPANSTASISDRTDPDGNPRLHVVPQSVPTGIPEYQSEQEKSANLAAIKNIRIFGVVAIIGVLMPWLHVTGPGGGVWKLGITYTQGFLAFVAIAVGIMATKHPAPGMKQLWLFVVAAAFPVFAVVRFMSVDAVAESAGLGVYMGPGLYITFGMSSYCAWLCYRCLPVRAARQSTQQPPKHRVRWTLIALTVAVCLAVVGWWIAASALNRERTTASRASQAQEQLRAAVEARREEQDRYDQGYLPNGGIDLEKKIEYDNRRMMGITPEADREAREALTSRGCQQIVLHGQQTWACP